MKMIIVALALVAVALAAELPKQPLTLRSEYDLQPEGGYNFGFETDDGTQRQEEGTLKEALNEDNKPRKVVVVRGSYSYINDQGNVDTVNYIADETGFHAEGPSIPKNPTPTRR